MLLGTRILVGIILFCGCVAFLVGIIVILGLGSIVPLLTNGSGSLKPAVSIISLAAGAPTLLIGVLVIGFGHLINLVALIAERVLQPEDEAK